MAVALFVVPGIAAGLSLGRPPWPPRRHAPAARRWRRPGGGRPRLAAAGDADAGGRPALDLGHGGQQHLVADLQLQRRRPGHRPDRRARSGFGGGGGGGAFGGATGVFRLLSSGLGDQAGWLLGFAVVAGLGVLVASRLRRSDPRTGWLIAVGGAFLVSAVVFSYASGIFHPYYVSFLAPFTAMLIGAGVGEALSDGRVARDRGARGDRRRRGHRAGRARQPLRRAVLGQAADHRRRRGACAILLARSCPRASAPWSWGWRWRRCWPRPATWAAETLGHATAARSRPAGRPAPRPAASAGRAGGRRLRPRGFGGAGRGGFGARVRAGGFAPGAGRLARQRPAGGARAAASRACSATRSPRGLGRLRLPAPWLRCARAALAGPAASAVRAAPSAATRPASTPRSSTPTTHGGGAIGVESQSTAAAAILSNDADVAGLGGFSGRESTVSARGWRWRSATAGCAGSSTTGSGGFGGFGGDSRQGSRAAMAIAEQVGRKVTVTSNGTTITMYDLQGKASAILAAAGRS